MNRGLLYPRIDDATAVGLMEELRDLSPMAAQERGAVSHGAQYFAPVGGRRATEPTVASLQAAVLEVVGPWLEEAERGRLTQVTRPNLDRVVGRALHENLGIIRSDAAHDGVWSFLTLVVLPGVLVARFPDPAVERGLGRPRNVLRRAWWRHEVLGDLADPPDRHPASDNAPLGEDEMVQLMERPNLASDSRLVRHLADRILKHGGADRSAFARRLTRRVLAELAHVEAAVLSDEELQLFVEAIERPQAGPPAAPVPVLAADEPPPPTLDATTDTPVAYSAAAVPIEVNYMGTGVDAILDPTSRKVRIVSDWWPGSREPMSPSAAAMEVIRLLNPDRESPETNGWTFWRLKESGEVISALRD